MEKCNNTGASPSFLNFLQSTLTNHFTCSSHYYVYYSITEPALVVVYPDDIELLAGDSVILTCVGYGVPAPLVTWQRNGEQIVANSSKFRVTETVVIVNDTMFLKSTLLLCNASELDIGDYSCMAGNTVQEPASVTFSVAVKSKF